ncbi:MAG: sugar ABC transporter substrate-binding protein [Spirochaetia bacterium]|nr:sugar ABC transporter substrate-binding protein [Spirochaetia bacterium]
MRKITALVLVALFLTAGLFAQGAQESATTGMTVGMTVQDLSNQIWSGSCEALKKLVVADGGKMTYLDCSNNSAKQIQQLENFIASKVNAIVVHPVDSNAVEPTLAAARKAGIKVYCWDENVTNSDINWLIDTMLWAESLAKRLRSSSTRSIMALQK